MNETISNALEMLLILIIALASLSALLSLSDRTKEMNAAINENAMQKGITSVNQSESGSYDNLRRMVLSKDEVASEVYGYRGSGIVIVVGANTLNIDAVSDYSSLLGLIPNRNYVRVYSYLDTGEVFKINYVIAN